MAQEPTNAADLASAIGDSQSGKDAPRRAGSSREPVPNDIDMRIGRDGTWFYHGSPITRKPLVRLFSTVLRREDDDQFYLVTPVEKGRVTVDDAPFVAVGMEVEGEGAAQTVSFRTNVGDRVTADADHPIRVVHDPATAEPSPYVLVRDRLEALINRPIYYDLVEIGVEREHDGKAMWGVWSAGTFFVLGPLEA